MLDKSKSLNDDFLSDVVGGNGDQEKKCDGCGTLFSLKMLTSASGGKCYCSKCYEDYSSGKLSSDGNTAKAKSGSNGSSTSSRVKMIGSQNA